MPVATPPLLVTLALQVAVSLTFGLSFLGLWRGFHRPLAARWAAAWLAYAAGISLAALGVALGTRGVVSPFGGAVLALPLQLSIILVRAGTDSVVSPPPDSRRYVVAAGAVLAFFVAFHSAVALGLLPLPATFSPYVMPRFVVGVELAWAAWPLLRAAVPRWAEGVGLMAMALVGLSLRMFVNVATELRSILQSEPSQPENVWLSILMVCLLMVFGVATAFVLVEGERLTAVQSAETIREKSAALEASEARAVEFFTAAPSGLVILDAEGHIRQANARFAALFGNSPAQLQGQPIDDLLPGVFRGQPEALIRLVASAEPGQLPAGRDVMGRRRDASEFPLEVSLSPVALPDAVVIASAIDLTERKRAEAALETLEDQLRQAQKMEADRPARRRRRARLQQHPHGHHRLRELLLQLDDASPIRLRDEARARFAARRRARRQPHAPAPGVQPPAGAAAARVDLNEVVDAHEQMLQRAARRGHRRSRSTPAPRRSATVRADPGQIEQVLLNLAVNARDAMPSGGRLALATAQRRRSTRPDAAASPGARRARYVVLSRDATPASAWTAEALARIFEPFFTTKERRQGHRASASPPSTASCSSTAGWIDGRQRPWARAPRSAVFLPPRPPQTATAPRRRRSACRPAGGETILVVEDEPRCGSSSGAS